MNTENEQPIIELSGNDYDYMELPTGESIAVNRETGEVYETIICRLPVGTSIITPAQKEEVKKIRKQRMKNELCATISKELGGFCFVDCNEKFDDIQPSSLIRLIYLGTYLGYNTNKLMRTLKIPMKFDDLQKSLNLSETSTYDFWNEVSPKYLNIDSDGDIIISDEFMFRHGIHRKNYGTSYQKFYINSIRKLYKSTDPRNHKHLGYIFKMLPLINKEFNIICYNPDEKTLDMIEPIEIEDFCNMIGYDYHNVRQLMKLYSKIKFKVRNEKELQKFCSFVYDGDNKEQIKIFVNPNIIDCGSDFEKVEVLGAFCKDNPNTRKRGKRKE